MCSGIGAPEVSAPWLDWRWRAEIDAHCNAVAEAHWPGMTNLGDMNDITTDRAEPVDLIVAGTPCQDFSVAGLRAGLAGERGNLTLRFVELLGELRPRWFVWENVPGVLSMDGGRSFGTILGRMASCGYGTAYRILDAQYFGLAQRRKRLFVVGCLGDWRAPAAVLFERESLRRDTPPRREAGEGVAGTLTASLGGSDENDAKDGRLIAHTLLGVGYNASSDGSGRGTPLAVFSCKNDGSDSGPIAPTLRAMSHGQSHANAGGQVAVAVSLRGREGGGTAELTEGAVPSIRASQGGGDKPYVLTTTVRRLTPVEAEALQGFPRGFTLAPYRGKPLADGPRYRMLGNSMAVPVIGWILDRLAMVDKSNTAGRGVN